MGFVLHVTYDYIKLKINLIRNNKKMKLKWNLMLVVVELERFGLH